MISNEHTRIRGKEILTAELGYWPEFCDAKILELTFHLYSDTGAKLSILLHYIDMDLNQDLNVKIILHSISCMNFNEFCVENVIARLGISESNEPDLFFEIEACAGLYGSCKCKELDVELVSSVPYSKPLQN